MRKLLFLVLFFIIAINFSVAQDLDSLLARVSDQILGSSDSCKPVFVYKVLGKSAKDGVLRYYLVLYAASYNYNGKELGLCSGYSDAAVLEVRGDSIKILLPAEGEDYASSIRRMFPRQLVPEVFNRYKYFKADSVEAVADQKAMKVWHLRRVTVYMPENLNEYEKLMNQYYFEGGENPLSKVKFYPYQVLVPDTANIYRLTALAAYRQYPPFGNKRNAQIVYFERVRDTVYILTNADIDGWAGVSNYLVKVRPIIERSLLHLRGVKAVIWRRR